MNDKNKTLIAGAVIGAATGGITEIILDKETGLIVPPDDPQALAEALIKLLRDPQLRAHLGSAGRKRVESLYDLPIIGEELIAFYHELTGRHQNM